MYDRFLKWQLDADAEGNIYDLGKEMTDFWMSKGECRTDELDDYFSLVRE